MTTTSVTDVLAHANAAMVRPHPDVTGALAELLTGVTEVLSADAAAVLVTSDSSLEVLAATSHRTLDLEIYQSQVDEGPCIDSLRTGEGVSAHGEEALLRRWPLAGPVILSSGYAAVHATPLRWHDETFGALNVFWADESRFQERLAECRALGDALTLVLVCGRLGDDALVESLRIALHRRTVVEQAKGALAHVLRIAPGAGYDALTDFARREGTTLGDAAERVMLLARRGALGEHLEISGPHG
jgi:hypothetical protein